MPATSTFISIMLTTLIHDSGPFSSSVYLLLFSDAGCTNELYGGSYARQQVFFPDPDGATSMATNSDTTFLNMPGGPVRGAGIADDVSLYNRILLYSALPTPLTLAGGDTLTFSAGHIILSGF